MTTRAERLETAVDALVDVPMRWGVDDCTAWVAQWVAKEIGQPVDVPQYSTEAEALALIEREGGLDRIWHMRMQALGIRRRYDESPVLGDVGLIDTRFGLAGGIFADAGVFCWRAERAVRLLPPRVHTIRAIWELP